MNKQDELLKLLVEEKIVTLKKSEELKKALQGNLKIENLLIKESIVNLEKLTSLKSKLYNLEYKNLSNAEFDENTLNIIPQDVALNYQVICFSKEDNLIKVGLVDPYNFKAMEAVNFLAQRNKTKVKYYLISDSSFQRGIKQYKKMEEEISVALEDKAKEEGEELIQVQQEKESLASEEMNSAPVAKIVSVIIRHAVEGRASDIHIEPLPDKSRIRYRIDGILHTSLILPKNIHNAVVARIKVLAKLKLDETRVPQDGRIRLLIDGREIDFRISTFPLMGSEKVVMRILDTSKGAPPLEELGYNNHALEIVKRNIKKTSGIFLVVGPTGSGKTTTLYSVLDILNKEGINISTLEDPIEYYVQGINQSQVRPKIGYTFANGLRSILRQDPDIIMVGEIRDNETAELSIHSGLTGHFVLSSLHANNAIGTLPRLLDMEVEPFLLGSTLKIIAAQRLVRRLCKHCKKKVKIDDKTFSIMDTEFKELKEETIKQEWQDWPGIEGLKDKSVFEPVGCPRCNGTGFVDRIAVVEVIEITPAIKEIIMNKEKNLSINDVKNDQIFISMKQDGMLKVLKGVTSVEEVLRVVEI